MVCSYAHNNFLSFHSYYSVFYICSTLQNQRCPFAESTACPMLAYRQGCLSALASRTMASGSIHSWCVSHIFCVEATKKTLNHLTSVSTSHCLQLCRRPSLSFAATLPLQLRPDTAIENALFFMGGNSAAPDTAGTSSKQSTNILVFYLVLRSV